MASSSSLSRSWLYHVFLSFRGEDVRKGFLSHVMKELKSKGILPFLDNEMKRGESIDAELIGAIRQSRVAVVLLSRNYASSSWCLDELVEIMTCREEDGQTVMTIFYEVDPTDVRKQTGDFGKAFEKTCVGKTEEVKKAWRKALKDVAGIAGYASSNSDNEADLINKVASNVTAVLGFTPSRDFDDFVGIEGHITEIKSKLILQTDDVKVIGVVGPVGIGKTTTARALYNQLSPGFSFSTFLENIRGSYEKPCGNDYQLKLRLQKNLLTEIFNKKDIEVGHLGAVQQMMSDKKVLVVLDEVDSWWQLEEMAKQRGWFGPGSIIIITTEDRKPLKQLRLGINHIYEMTLPTNTESLEIFCQYAFGQKSPDKGFEELAQEVTWLSGDLPLVLRVMGSYVRGMSRGEWIDALPRLRSGLDREIESTLRFSYDGLTENDKALFLHIACFFNFTDIDDVKMLLENCGLEVNHGLQVLADKSLICKDYKYIKMHKLLQKMGREIVKKQSLDKPGKQQFLWKTREISGVLERDTGTGKVLCIRFYTPREIQISKSAFDGMNNLRFLKLSPCPKLCIPEGLNCFPDTLRLLHWEWCPLRVWPSKFSAEFLVELIMWGSQFEKLWEGIKPLQCLKLMDLRFSKYLKEIPDLSKATSLEKLKLSGCKRLLEIKSSIGYILPMRLPEKVLSSPRNLHFDCSSCKTVLDCISREHGVSGCKELVALPPLPVSLQSIDAERCASLKRIDSPFHNPKIGLNFGACYNLNQKARKLIHTSACKYAFLPGKKVPAYFPHQDISGSLTINLTPTTPLPSSFRFKACILLSYNTKVCPWWTDVSCSVRGKQNGLTIEYRSNKHPIPFQYGYDELADHLYIFEDSFCLNQDCPEAEEATFSEISFVFVSHDEQWKGKGCGVRLLDIPHCSLDGIDDDDESVDDEDESDDDEEAENVDDGDDDKDESDTLPQFVWRSNYIPEDGYFSD